MVRVIGGCHSALPQLQEQRLEREHQRIGYSVMSRHPAVCMLSHIGVSHSVILLQRVSHGYSRWCALAH